MTPENFQYLAGLLKRESGQLLGADKAYLVESRLMPVARRRGIASLDELVDALRAEGANRALVAEITDAMTTNESLFFRDIKPFEQFRDIVLPQLMIARAGTRRMRIWSAACSSGQEPYSLAMLVREEEARLHGWKVEIVATDISAEMLAKAKAGLYSQFEVQRGLPVQLLVKYFTNMGEKWRIDPSLLEMVEFRRFNLLDDPTPLGVFDVIFCRNVLIYFDHPTKASVLDRIADLLAPDGYLYLGGAETVLGVCPRFRPIQGERGVYTRVIDVEGPAKRKAVS